jgi:hypothetical protein
LVNDIVKGYKIFKKAKNLLVVLPFKLDLLFSMWCYTHVDCKKVSIFLVDMSKEHFRANGLVFSSKKRQRFWIAPTKSI